MDAQSAKVTKQAAKLGALQGASEDSCTRKHRVRRTLSLGPPTKMYQSFTERHHNTRCGEIRFLSHLSMFSAEKPLRRGLTQSSPMTNETCSASCDGDIRPAKLTRQQMLRPFWPKELFSLLWSTRSSRQGYRMAARKSSRVYLSQEGLPNNIRGSQWLRTSACKRWKVRWYGSVALTVPETCLRAPMPTRPRLCYVDRSSSTSPASTTRNDMLCSGVATFPATSSRKSFGTALPRSK